MLSDEGHAKVDEQYIDMFGVTVQLRRESIYPTINISSVNPDNVVIIKG